MFQRLKKEEDKNLEWSVKRELAKVNYHIHTSSIKENLIVPELSKEQIYFTYASEGRSKNPNLKGNMRDYASVEQLLVLANMESYNSILIAQGLRQYERIVLLHNMAISQIEVLTSNNFKILEDKNKIND